LNKNKSIGLTLDRLFTQTLMRNPAEYLLYKDRRITYKDFRNESALISNAIINSDLGGKTIGVLDWNTIEFSELLYGIPLGHSIIHPVNIRLPPDQMIRTIKSARDKALFFSKDFAPLVEKIISLGLIEREKVYALGEFQGGYNYFKDLLHGETNTKFPESLETDKASVLFTSGTTNEPKGIIYSQRDMVLAIWSILTMLSSYDGNSRISSKDIIFSLIPYYHIWSWGTLYFATMLGSRYVMDGRFDPESTLSLIEREKVTWMSMVPTMLYSLLSSPNSDKLNGMKILIGGAAIPIGLVNMALKKNIELTSIYGFTDGLIAGIGTLKRKGSREKYDEFEISTNSITPAPYTEFEFDSSKGGEIKFRAPWLPEGYFNNPEESSKAYSEDGWFMPGDAGYLDSEGNIRIADRIKDLIKSGAEFIPSAIVENAISNIDSVEMAAVIGKEDLKWGERPWCFVKLRNGMTFNEKELRDALSKMVQDGKIKEWWIPDKFLQIDEMPLTSTGKIDKKNLRERINSIR